MSQLTFGEKVKDYLKAAGSSQKILANALGMERTLLNHKLNATGRNLLTHPEIKQIVRALAELEAITTQPEALALLAEVNCPNFSHAEWQARPLKDLEEATSLTTIVSSKPGLAIPEKKAVKAGTFLPTDTLTFLFTDIEGSTALWEKQPQTMQTALGRHDTLLRQAVETHGGKIFKTVGDGFYAAFPTANGALEAALAAQQVLLVEKWPETLGEIKVRMALHTGSAEERDSDYFGQALNRTVRLLAAGHGGQILLSLASAELLRDHLPKDITLRELGLYRLKDLIRPERIFQVVAPELPGQFPPLKTLESYQHNLPVQLTSFIGRETEIEQVKELLCTSHLLTLTGAGGVGKTRLALQVGADLLESFKEGVWLVELAPLTEPALVGQIIVQTLGLRQERTRPPLDTLVDYFKARQALLILDNCEHLIEACASLTGELLEKCAELRILATSRETFEINGEVTYRVPSLSLPDLANLASRDETVLEQLTQFEAVRLFIERAKAAHPGFRVGNQTAPTVAQICYHLDGIPLAIELAAARVSYLSVEQILQHLDDRFRLLKGGSRTSLPRHQTLHALIDWSYSLLSRQEQLVLSRLAVFAGGFNIEAAEKVCAGEDIAEPDVLDYLMELARKSLIQAEEISNVEPVAVRYRMLETIRQYGLEKLEMAGETYQTQLRHLNYFVALAQEAEIKLNSSEQITWLNRIEQEFDNIRAALSWAMANRLGEAALKIAASLRQFWHIKSYWIEGRQWTEAALKAAGNAPNRLKAKGLEVAAWLVALLDEYETATVFARQSLELYRSLGDRRGQAYAQAIPVFIAYAKGASAYSETSFKEALALVDEVLAVLKQEDYWYYAFVLNVKGTLYEAQGELEKARSCYEEGLTVTRELGNKSDMAWYSCLLGRLSLHQLNFERAIKFLTESAGLYREIGSTWGLGAALGLYGVVEMYLGNYEHSRIMHEESMELMKKVNLSESQAIGLRRVGLISLFEKNYTRARELFRESLIPLQKYERKDNLASSLKALGYLAWRDGKLEQAARLIGAGEALFKKVCTHLVPEDSLMQEHFIKVAKTQLEEGGFLKALAEGGELPLEQAIALALQEDQTAVTAD